MKLRAARDLLCLRSETHTHEDMIAAVLKDCGGYEGDYFDEPPDFRTKTVRQSIKALTNGRAARRNLQNGNFGFEKQWRPLFEDDRSVSFDVDAFTAEFPQDVHQLPEGDMSGGQPWTCKVKAWASWSARATREKTKAKADSSSDTDGTGRKASESKGSQWLQAVKADPVVRERLGAKGLRSFKTADDLSAEDREALGTRVEPAKTNGYYRDDVFPLPAAEARFDPHDYPPMFDFSECQTCTVGAAYGERYYGSGVSLLCTDKQLYMDRMSRGIEKFLAWRDERAARDRSEDLRLVEALGG